LERNTAEAEIKINPDHEVHLKGIGDISMEAEKVKNRKRWGDFPIE